MATVMIAIAAAIVHTLAIMGYLSILACLTISSPQISWKIWVKVSLRILLYVAGIGSIFLAPAYLYGQFKALITDEIFIAFAATEVIAVIVLIFSVKTWNALLPNNSNATEKKE